MARLTRRVRRPAYRGTRPREVLVGQTIEDPVELEAFRIQDRYDEMAELNELYLGTRLRGDLEVALHDGAAFLQTDEQRRQRQRQKDDDLRRRLDEVCAQLERDVADRQRRLLAKQKRRARSVRAVQVWKEQEAGGRFAHLEMPAFRSAL